MRTFTTSAWIALVCACAANAHAQNQPSPQAQFDAISAEFKKAQTEFNEEYRKATTDEERKSVIAAKYPKAEPYAQRHRYYPIPAIQIELSKVNGANTLTQNPGW